MNHSYRRFFAFFRQFLRPYWGIFSLVTFLSAFNSLVWLYNAYAFSKIVTLITSYKTGASLQPFYTILITLGLVTLFRQIARFKANHLGILTAEKASMDIEVFSIHHLSKIDIAWHEKENTGNKMKRIDRGSNSMVVLSRIWINIIIDVAVSLVGILFIISRFDRMLALLMAVYAGIYYLIASFTRTRGVRALQLSNIKAEEITGLWFEIVSNIRSVKVLGMAKKVLEFSFPLIGEYVKRASNRIFWFQGTGFVQGLWTGLGRIALLLFVIFGIVEGRYEVGFIILFYGYFNTLSESISQVTSAAQDIAAEKKNIERLTDILDEPIGIDDEVGKVDFPEVWDAIHIRNMSSKYGNNIVLSDINLTIKKGEKVGIVGLSGAGKSTIFKLLLKEYENYEGDILIGEVPLKNIKKTSYVNHSAAVLQETEVFNMSLHRNIVLANSVEMENRELFERALTIAHVNDFLPKLALGVETLIGEKGVKLSGGEKQRLGIARAVFKNPEILFFDEATSHLDVESEQKIQDSLQHFFKDVTAVVIAHRLSTIREMDRIVVIEHGKILEIGTFDELYEKDGRFREFWDKQRV